MDIELRNDEGKKQCVHVTIINEGTIYKYYINGEVIGVYDPNVMEDNILELKNSTENELSAQIKDGIRRIDITKIEKEGNRNAIIKEYAEERNLGRIRNIYTVDINKYKTPKRSEESQKGKKEVPIQNNNIYQEEEKVKANKDIDIKQEIKLSELANDMHDLRKWLGAQIPPQFTKIVVIESDDMNKMKDEKSQPYERDSTRYSLALVDKDNNIEPLQKYIPNLEQRSASGNNPTEEKYQVDKNGNVEKDAILSEYEIGKKIIQIDNKQMGRIQVNVGKEEYTRNTEQWV